MDNQIIPLEEKLIDFNGSELMAVKCNDGNIYAGVRWVCNGLGLTDNQRRGQYIKLNEDLVLNQGVKKISLPTNSGNQGVLCIELDYLPLWLAKINAGIIGNQDVQERVMQYQLKAKDVLVAAFMSQPMTELQILRGAIDQIEVAQRMALEAKEEAAQANQQIQAVKEAIIQTDRDWRWWVNKQLQRIGFKLGDYQGIKNESYDLLKQRGRCNLDQRLDNLRNRMRTAGSTRTQLATANYLDVIEAEPRLKEIYTAIVRELSVKYVA